MLGYRNKDRNKILVTLDLENASNSLGRPALLQDARRCSPRLVPWADICHKATEQPFKPRFSPMALQRANLAARQTADDDGIVAGEASAKLSSRTSRKKRPTCASA